MAPLSHYDKNKGGERPQIQINVNSLSDINATTASGQRVKAVEGEVIENNTDC
jgi:hypothetical protein